MRLLTRLFLSRNLAVGAMVGLGLLLGLSSFAAGVETDRLEELRATRPLRVWVFERIRPEELTRTRLFLVLPGYIGLAVAASILHRGRGFWRARRTRGPAPLERFVARREVQLHRTPAEVAPRVEAALRRCGFSGGSGASLERHGNRGELGFAGSLVFHAGMLVTLIGVSASALGRFNGEVVLTEGIPLTIESSTVLRASPPEGLRALDGTRLTVGQVAAGFGGKGSLTDVSAVIDAEPPGAAALRQMVSVNVPVEVKGYQLSLHRYGFAPEFVATDDTGRERTRGVAVVRVLPPGAEDSILLEGGGELFLTFFPDFVERAGAPASASLQPLRPVVAFRWVEAGRTVASGRVGRGEESLVAGHRVSFPSLRYWADFNVAKDPGLPWVTAGAFLIILGLAVRFAWHEQAWHARVAADGTGARVWVTISARYFPANLEQRADALVRTLEVVT